MMMRTETKRHSAKTAMADIHSGPDRLLDRNA